VETPGIFVGGERAHSDEVGRQHLETFIQLAEFARESFHQALKLIPVSEVRVVRFRDFLIHTVGG
jgi:hypothetical protein